MANNKIQLASLEFDSIKQNLKAFLQGQDRFSDFDFEGSNMSVLLDVLSYNTHYNAMYINMALNEAYLDSANKRNSVVSLAKGIGYLPRSATCGTTNVFFTIVETSTQPEFLTITKHAQFQGVKDGVRYSLYTTEDVTSKKNELRYGVAPTGTFYQFANIKLLEGSPVSNLFEQTQNNVYLLPNSSIDLSTLKVSVRPAANSSVVGIYTNGNSLANLNGDSLVYFIKEVDNGFYEMSFGEGVIGKALEPGNIITVEYFVSSGIEVNGIRNISYSGEPLMGGVVSNIVIDAAVNSARDAESTEEIRNNAPAMWQSQNRAVTADDYRVVLLNKVSGIKDVIVWGGEKNDPPIYGKVFICATSNTNSTLSAAVKESIKTTVLDQYKVVTVIPEFVDPEYLDVGLTVSVYYDQTMTNKTPATIISDLVSSYAIYNSEELQKFGSIVRNSEIINIAESSDRSIVNVVPSLRISKHVTPLVGVAASYQIKFGNPIEARDSAVFSTGFTSSLSAETAYIENRANGDLVMYYVSGGAKITIRTIGTVDFGRGTVNIANLTVLNVVGGDWIFKMLPNSADVVGLNNQIARLDMTNLKVNVIADSGNKNNYQFTSTRA
jgi:hypothetical protein